MASKRNARTRKAAARKAAEKKLVMNLGIVIVVILAVIWIGTSGKKESIVESTPADTAQVDVKQYDAPPEMTIDPNVQYFATVKMANGGEFIIQLYPAKAPITVNSFIFLARE
ncbi:MAG: hypothetical protein L3J16_07745, partial [Anaerolineales bacterium]|nr:hypothetical protein [Anaerolineales bacterium]